MSHSYKTFIVLSRNTFGGMKNMKEEWKDIKGYEGLYEVSNMGRVKSLGNGKSTNNDNCRERILKPVKDKGYLRVTLCKEGRKNGYLVHQLVAIVFCENSMGYKEVNHKDEDKTNNRADNLEWCTSKYNANYGTRNKRISKPIYSINKVSGLITYWTSAKEAGNVLGIPPTNITRCCKGKLNSAGNHYWFYADDDDNE